MGVDAHVARGSAQALSFSVGNVLLRLGIPVLLRHAKVDDVHHWAADHLNKRRGEGEEDGPFEFFVPGRPMRKLSGLISRYMRFFSWMVCTRDSYRRKGDEARDGKEGTGCDIPSGGRPCRRS